MGEKIVKSEAEVRSYRQANWFLGARTKAKIANDTWVVWNYDGDSFTIRHGKNANLIEYYPDASFRVSDLACWSPVQISRLNQFGPHGWTFIQSQGQILASVNDKTILVAPNVRYPVFPSQV